MKCKTGFKEKKGKCMKIVKRKSSSRKKKSYNPFKMWESYLGAVIGFLLQFKMWGYETTMSSSKVFLVSRFKLLSPSNVSQYNFLTGLDIVIFVIAGFLLGWGIYYLIRRYKKWIFK